MAVVVRPYLMRRSAVFGAAFAGAALASCSLFPDLSGLTDGRETADAAAAGDGALASETGPDARAGRSLCAASHLFCDDFDQGDAYLAKWGNPVINGSGEISPSATALSLPRAAEMRMGRREADAKDAYAYIFKLFEGWSPLAIDFDVFMTAPDWRKDDVNSGIFYIGFEGGTPATDLAVSIGPTYASIGGSALVQGNPIPMNTWVHCHFEVDPKKGTVVAQMGQNPYSGSWAPSAEPATGARINVGFGIFGYNAPAPEFRIAYDNIVVDPLK